MEGKKAWFECSEQVRKWLGLPYLLFSVFCYFDIGGLADSGGSALPRAARSWREQLALEQIQTNWFIAPPPTSHTLNHYPPALISPCQGPENRRQLLQPSLLKRFKPVSACSPALPDPSCGNHRVLLMGAPPLSAFLLSPVLPLCGPHNGVHSSHVLGIVINELSFQWQSFSDLLSLPYLKFSVNALYFEQWW